MILHSIFYFAYLVLRSLTSRWICGIRLWSQCLIQQCIQTLTKSITCWISTAQMLVTSNTACCKYGFYFALFSGLLIKPWPCMMRWVIDTFFLFLLWFEFIALKILLTNHKMHLLTTADTEEEMWLGQLLDFLYVKHLKKKKLSCINHKNILYMQNNFSAKVWEINQSLINERLFIFQNHVI